MVLWVFFRWHNARQVAEAVTVADAPSEALTQADTEPQAEDVTPEADLATETPAPRTKRSRRPKATTSASQPTNDTEGGQDYTGDDTGP